MTCAAFVPGHSGGAVPDFHRIPYSSDRSEQPDTSDREQLYHPDERCQA